jgi:transcriptional regulator with XRE-family HTH domain
MTIDNEPLVFDLRRLRRDYRDSGFTQEQLAKLAGVSTRVVHEYEASTGLSSSVECLLRIALALNVPIEELIAADLIDELRADVAARRAEYRLTPTRRGATGDDDEP